MLFMPRSPLNPRKAMIQNELLQKWFNRIPYLNHDEIIELLESVAVSHYDQDLVNTASLDIRLGETLLVEDWVPNGTVIDYGAREQMKMREITMDDGGYVLRPGEFILAHTYESFDLPDDIAALLRAKSSMGRTGLEHMDAGWVDPWVQWQAHA